MPIPHPDIVFGALMDQLKSSSDEILISRATLRRLLDLYISSWEFDEEWYLETYPDVRVAIEEKQFASGWDHYRSVGYLEGRFGSRPLVNNDWYVETYPDVAQAIIEGKVASASDHYLQFGRAEGRLPEQPNINAKWYIPRYMPMARGSDRTACLAHFLLEGYRNLAIPAPPR
jgi:hypothetical protein